MKETLARLVELAEWDRVIAKSVGTLDDLASGTRNAKKGLEKAQAGVKRAVEATKESQAKTHRYELDLQTAESKVESLGGKLNTASSNKEYSAILLEIGATKAEAGKIEEQILLSMDAHEAVERAEDAARVVVKEAEATLRAAEAKVEERRGQIEEQVEHAKKRREETAAALPDDARRLYEKLLGAKNMRRVLAAVDGEYCMNCQMKLAPQQVAEVIGGRKLVQCRSCRCILVAKPQS